VIGPTTEGRYIDSMPVTRLSARRSRGAFAVLLLALVATGGVMALKVAPSTEPSTVQGLPHTTQSWLVAQAQQSLPQAQSQPALVVVERRDGRPLTSADVHQLGTVGGALVGLVEHASPVSVARILSPLVVSPDGRVAFTSVSVSSVPNDNAVSTRVLALRHGLTKLVPADLVTFVTGAPAFTTDLGQVFNGANLTLLFATVIVVAALLVVTYRSPLLWLIPLLVVGTADQVAGHLAAFLAPHVGIRLDGAATGIAEVLVFGAGTDYALLLIARYREELRRRANRFDAMAHALGRTAETVVASGATVTIALVLLLLASVGSTRALGFAGALGILTAIVFALGVLPAALLVCGRVIFWPFVPREGEQRHGEGRIFARVGDAVQRHLTTVLAASVIVLVASAALGLGAHVGLSTTQQFTATPESVRGEVVLASQFPAGSSDPAVIMVAPARVAGTLAAARAVSGVARVTVGAHSATWTELDATLTSAPGSAASFRTIDALRAALGTASGHDALVGGDVATTLDAQRANNRDAGLLAPLILLVVFLALVVLLRALVAPLLLLATVLGSFFAAFGLSWLIFQHVAHYPALASGVPFLAFLFLVALGVDYNIFLTSRAREEAATRTTSDAMLVALRATGGVITSAGVLLASVFAVLGVLPLIQLTQIGIIVCVGVLLDTLLVRTVLVPALALRFADSFWWPRRPGARPTT